MVFTKNLTHLFFQFSFKSARRLKAVQGCQGHPTGTWDAQKDREGRPTGAQRRLKGSQRHSSRPQRVPQVTWDGEVEPKSTPKGAKGSPRSSQRKPKEPQRHPREASGALYINKLPINRPSGRYVMDSIRSSQGAHCDHTGIA